MQVHHRRTADRPWLGHYDAGFTLKTFAHLIDDGLGGADFLDEAVKAH